MIIKNIILESFDKDKFLRRGTRLAGRDTKLSKIQQGQSLRDTTTGAGIGLTVGVIGDEITEPPNFIDKIENAAEAYNNNSNDFLPTAGTIVGGGYGLLRSFENKDNRLRKEMKLRSNSHTNHLINKLKKKGVNLSNNEVDKLRQNNYSSFVKNVKNNNI